MADLSKFQQTRRHRPTWNGLDKDPDPVVITYRVPTRGALLALRQSEADVGAESPEFVQREEQLAFLRAHVVEVEGVPDEDPVGFIHGVPGLCAEVAGTIWASCFVSADQGNG